MTQTGNHKDDDTVLAGEYALHLLDPNARRAFEARLSREPELRAMLRDWDENLVTPARRCRWVRCQRLNLPLWPSRPTKSRPWRAPRWRSVTSLRGLANRPADRRNSGGG